MSNSLNDLSESQCKIIIDRVSHTEKNVNLLLEAVNRLSRKEEKSRDAIDIVSKVVKNVSENETQSLGNAMDNLATSFAHIGDIRTLQTERIDEKIINELIQYESICRNAREEIKNLISLRDREIIKRRNIEINKKTRNQGVIENEIMLSNMQISKILKELYNTAENFEKHRLTSMKEILKNFVLINMHNHTASLQIFSEVYNTVNQIDDKADLEEFKKHLEKDTNINRKSKLMRAFSRFSQSTSNLERIGRRDDKSSNTKSRHMKKSQSQMSLNSIESNDSEEVDKETQQIDISADTKTSESDDSDIDNSSILDDDDNITEAEIPVNQPSTSKSTLTRVKHAK